MSNYRKDKRECLPSNYTLEEYATKLLGQMPMSFMTYRETWALKQYIQSLHNAIEDTRRLAWIQQNLEWDGNCYWLPELCVREIALGEDKCEPPSLDNLRKFIDEQASRE